MKSRMISVFILFTVLLALNACSKRTAVSDDSLTSQDLQSVELDSSDDSADTTVNQPETEIISDEKYYKITRTGYLFQYYIYDDSHQIVKADERRTKEPDIFMVNEHLLRVSLQAGTGIGTQESFYYDAEKDSFSRVFDTVYDQYNELTAYLEKRKIVIRDIFDKSKYYFEFTSFEKPLAENVVIPVEDVKFSDDGKSIVITYLAGSEYEEVTQTVDLP